MLSWQIRLGLLIFSCAFISTCASNLKSLTPSDVTGVEDGSAIAVSSAGDSPVLAKSLLSSLEHPWGMTWVSDRDVLITLRPGQVVAYSLDSASSQSVGGLPPIFASGQGGLLDISAHPNFDQNQWVYISYSKGDRNQNRTTVARAKLSNQQFSDWQTIFEVADPKSGSQHFGSRLLWLPDGTLLVSIGDGGNPPIQFQGNLIRNQAQNLSTHFGKVIRIRDDGSVPSDNPLSNQSESLPELWSYGHRNIQGMALDPETGHIWSTEHGARGGDELNLMEAGQNYGWPLVSFSREYTADQPVAPSTSRSGFIDPKLVWTPSMAPSGLAVYRGDRYPEWQGQLFAGALVNQSIFRIAVNEKLETKTLEELPIGQRVRDIQQGPDGYLYVLTDSPDGRLLRLELQ